MEIERLKAFQFERVLKKDDVEGYLALLGSLPSENGSTSQAIVRIERTRDLPTNAAFLKEFVAKIEVVGRNDIYSWMKAWLIEDRSHFPDLKIDVTCPATETHIRKYTHQDFIMVQETTDIYSNVVWPYIQSFDPKRTEWIRKIFDGEAEQESIIYSSPAFILVHDMKWAPPTPDNPSLDKMYLLAISRPSIGLRSLRDLRGRDIPFLKEVRQAGIRAANNYGLTGEGRVRMFVHYQPSYYYFHVHIVNANHHGLTGMVVGQAHLLDDIISMLEIDGEIFAKMTVSYGLGEQHALLEKIREYQAQG